MRCTVSIDFFMWNPSDLSTLYLSTYSYEVIMVYRRASDGINKLLNQILKSVTIKEGAEFYTRSPIT